jgi:DNA modification methylase
MTQTKTSRKKAKAKAEAEEKLPPPERRERRSLSHVGGAVEIAGPDLEAARVLKRALDVRADEASTMRHVHGFHSYPARLHPDTAARLIEGLSKPGDTVLDPFCGSGTILVEAHRLGRRALGIDANPLAIELAKLKTLGLGTRETATLVQTAEAIYEKADKRRLAKAAPTRRYGPEDRELFDIHVLLELDSIASGIDELPRGEMKRALFLVFSAMLTKVSKQPGDTTGRKAPRRLPAGFALQFFVKKTEELVRRLEQYAALVPDRRVEVKVGPGDARYLERIRAGSVALIVTSPPYPGVYDYHAHHATRLRWLELESERFERFEIGSRRGARGKSFEMALGTWRRELGASLAEMARVISAKGAAALIIADSVIAGRALRAEELTADLARNAGLVLVARASQKRPHFHLATQSAFRGAPRREHVILVRKA